MRSAIIDVQAAAQRGASLVRTGVEVRRLAVDGGKCDARGGIVFENVADVKYYLAVGGGERMYSAMRMGSRK